MAVALAEKVTGKVTESGATSITPSDDVALPAVAPGDTLRNAARYIEEHGWCQGQLRSHAGAVCALGAILSVCRSDYDDWTWNDQSTAACEVLGEYLGVSGATHVANWNDRDERTRDEVLEALRGAAG